MDELATVALHSSLSLGQRAGLSETHAADAPRRLAREFDAMVFRLLWRTTAMPGPSSAKPATPALGATLADFYAPQIAAQHTAGFGAMVLAALGQGQDPHNPRSK